MKHFYRLAPNRVWRTYLGGKTLDGISGAAHPEDTHFPEDWLLSTTRAVNIGREEIDEGVSRVETEAGVLPLPELFARRGEEILGARHLGKFGPNPGFLLKYLDSAIRLHLQCHPTIPFARKFLGSCSGKSEGYCILGVRPGCEGYIYLGFQHPVSCEEFRRIVSEQDIPALLGCFDKIPVHPGDAFYVPGGYPHAIGEGVFMIEMMEPTDFVVRVEFERGGYRLPEASRFMGRGLDFAMSMCDFSHSPVETIRRERFVSPAPLPAAGAAERFSLFDARYTKCFRAEKIVVRGPAEVVHDSFRVLIVTNGSGVVECGSERCELRRFDRILVPRSSGKLRFDTADTMEIFAALPPEV